MKKILFVINTMERAGAEIALLEMIRLLCQEDVDISLFVLTGQGEMIGEVPEKVKILNKVQYETSIYTGEGKKRLVKTVLKALIRRGNVFRLFPYMLVQFVKMLGRRKVLIDKLLWRAVADGADRFDEHYDMAVAYLEGGSTYYVLEHVNATQKIAFVHVDYGMAGYTRSLDRACYLSYDKIFTVSNEVKQSFLKVYKECEDRVEIFHNIINRERILDLSTKQGGFNDSFDGYRILTVGRLTKQKDFIQSIRTMKILKEKGVKARWYVLGEGSKRKELEKEIKRLGLENDFFLLGMTANPYVYMAQADLYVHATQFEGKSLAIQEAQVLGCAILVSDCSGNREQVAKGVDGLLCNMEPIHISEKIIELLEDVERRKKFGKEASKRQMTDSREINKLISLL